MGDWVVDTASEELQATVEEGVVESLVAEIWTVISPSLPPGLHHPHRGERKPIHKRGISRQSVSASQHPVAQKTTREALFLKSHQRVPYLRPTHR